MFLYLISFEFNCSSQAGDHPYKFYKRRCCNSIRALCNSASVMLTCEIVSKLIVLISLLLPPLDRQLSTLILKTFYHIIDNAVHECFLLLGHCQCHTVTF